jgi:hypothetical protein
MFTEVSRQINGFYSTDKPLKDCLTHGEKSGKVSREVVN